ncbi:unnamed protein product [Diatraea saccharalis]|uniref:Uncharacterized protein n=1 Tax=Diatraea saccharalis TaxID=40085 RepID=A0A9N9QQ36_9NEOP|nr:unnamed protein product [Diatraea saccharalis]
MEFCPQLLAFQGVIISADNVHPFSRLTSKVGNEEKFKYIIDNISKFLHEGRYISSHEILDENKVRKFAFYVILNADLSVLTEITDLEEIALIIGTTPTIPKCLMCEIFWELHFEKFLYEAIAYTYPDLGLELASAFIDSIKYFSPSECLNKLQILCSGLYRIISRFPFFSLSNNILSDKLTVTFNNFQRCITYYTQPPKPELYNAMNEDERYKYIGNRLHSMLFLVYECVEQLTATQTLNPLTVNIYMLTYNENSMNPNRNFEFKICDHSNQMIRDCLNKCHVALMDKFQEVVMSVSLDIYCAWSEFEQSGITMQRKIGEFCHKVRTKLLSIPIISEHAVVDMLQQISCKPQELSDLVKSASVQTMIDNINSNCENKDVWLKALIQKDEVFTDESIVNCITSNIDLLNENESYELYKSKKDYLIENLENEEYLKSFVVKLFQQCNCDAKHEILEDYFSNNCFTDILETEDFINTMTEIFNKFIVSPDADLTDILCLFIQNPQKVYSKIFNLATENKHQADIMLKAMKLLENYSNHFYNSDTEPCIIRITLNTLCNLDSDAKKNNFIYFICELKNLNSITGTKLLLLVIMPKIHRALLVRDISTLNTQCKLLKEAYNLEELIEYRAPMLAMIGQILDVVRWKINTFNTICPPTLQLALELHFSFMNTYETEIPDNEKDWLKSKLEHLLPLNMYYYRKLWNHPGDNYVEIITGMELSNGMSTVQLATRLSQALCSSYQQEWINMWNDLTVFIDTEKLETFHDALFLITMLERGNRTEITWSCILYCYQCFIYLIRYNFFKQPLDVVQVSVVLEKIAVMCNFAQGDNVEDISRVILPLFAYLAERRNDYNFPVAEYLRTKLEDSRFLYAFTEVFTNGSD